VHIIPLFNKLYFYLYDASFFLTPNPGTSERPGWHNGYTKRYIFNQWFWCWLTGNEISHRTVQIFSERRSNELFAAHKIE